MTPTNIPMPPEPVEPWSNPFRKVVPPPKPSKAEELVKAALRASAKTHIGRLAR